MAIAKREFAEDGIPATFEKSFQQKLIPMSRSVQAGRDFLRHLLDYEIRGAMRYRRFLSLVLIDAIDTQAGFKALNGTFRGSDETIQCGDARLAVIMRDTDMDAAATALNRATSNSRDRSEFRVAFAFYPTDGTDGCDLLQVAEQRLALKSLELNKKVDFALPMLD